jgi:hypothetical protein
MIYPLGEVEDNAFCIYERILPWKRI